MYIAAEGVLYVVIGHWKEVSQTVFPLTHMSGSKWCVEGNKRIVM